MGVVETQSRASTLRPGNVGSTTLAWVMAAVLLAVLVWAGGLWNQLANSRLLDLLMRSGIVAFTDADQGFYRGVPDAQYYIASQDPVDWGMLLLTAVLLLAVFALRAARFTTLVRYAGGFVSTRDAMRAYLRGFSSGSFLPFGLGRAAMASELETQEVAPRTAGRTLVLQRFFDVLEIIVFTFIGLIALSWSTALGALVWPAAIAAVAYFIVRPSRSERAGEPGPFAGIRGSTAALSQEPATFVRATALSLVAFFGEVAAVYALSQAFSSANVILNIDFPVVLMAVVAGYVASYIQVTPGGFGQFEWGMAAALYIGGLGMPEAVTMPLLYAVLRYIVITIVYFASGSRGRETRGEGADLMDELERG